MWGLQISLKLIFNADDHSQLFDIYNAQELLSNANE